MKLQLKAPTGCPRSFVSLPQRSGIGAAAPDDESARARGAGAAAARAGKSKVVPLAITGRFWRKKRSIVARRRDWIILTQVSLGVQLEVCVVVP